MQDPTPDALTAALRSMLGELVHRAVLDALAEHQANEAPAPALLTVDGLCAALQVSRATLSRLRAEGMPSMLIGESPRFDLAAVLDLLRARADVRRAGASS